MWLLANRDKGFQKIKNDHPNPFVMTQAEDPAGSVCLCKLGVPLLPEEDDAPGAMLIYKKSSEEDFSSILQYFVADPVRSALWEEKSGAASGEARGVPERGLPRAPSSYSIHRAQKLWVTRWPLYRCSHNYDRPQMKGAKELSKIPAECQKDGCQEMYFTLKEVTNKHPSMSDDDEESWEIYLINY